MFVTVTACRIVFEKAFEWRTKFRSYIRIASILEPENNVRCFLSFH